jgi:signal transduction histidine kinase
MAFSMAMLLADSTQVFAQGLDGSFSALIGASGLLFGSLVMFISWAWFRKLKRNMALLRVRLGEVETQLNEAESALQSETQLLLTWRGRDEQPDRLIGSMHGTIKMPSTISELTDFSTWLERDSSNILSISLNELKKTGQPFNIAIKTINAELLEADGRTAGAIATLRFRPLSGIRREQSETQYDAHKLARQVERLSAILDGAPFPAWLADLDSKLIWVNKAYVKATEAGDSESVLQANLPLFRSESIDKTKADPSRHLIGRAHANQAGQVKAVNVHEVDLELYKAFYAVDVTALETAERELDRHITAHASTLDKLSTAIAIFGADQKLRFFNQAYVDLWQFDERWLRESPADGQILDRLRAERKLPEEANYKEWRNQQLGTYSKIEPREAFWYLPDGRSLRVIAQQHPLGGVIYLYENLTKEHQLESRYNELFEVQRETLDNLAEAVALSGPDGRLKLFNPAFMKFWSLNSSFLAEKPHVSELAQLKSLSAEARAAWQDIKFGITGIEAKRKDHEGIVEQDGRFLHYRAVPLPDGNALLTFTDVSDAAKAERALRDRTEALEAADRLKNRLLSNVSYEIRTPLTSIVGFSEGLEFGLAGPLNEKQKQYVANIRSSSEDLKTIIDSIIDLSAIDAGQMELTFSTVNVAHLLEQCAETFSSQLEKRKQNLTVEIASNVGTIIADPERLEKVVAQLLSNASGFSVPGSTIRMGARRAAQEVQIWVADNGRGIPPELQPLVFDRFQSKPSPGSHRGPGLGLAIVKAFTELHGGKVSLISKLEQGTTVVCSLPINGPRKNMPAGTKINPAAVA